MEQHLFKLILSLKSKCIANESRIQQELDISPAEFNALVVMQPGRSLTSAELAGHLGLTPSRTSRIVGKLEKRGFIKTVRPAENRRVLNITLQATGTSAKNRAEKMMLECEQRITSGLPEKQLEQIRRSLTSLVEIL